MKPPAVHFPQGTRVRLNVAWTAPDPVTGVVGPVNPTATLQVKNPMGVLSSPAVIADGGGKNHVLVDCDVAGEWRYQWSASGTNKGAAPGSFVIDPAPVP